MPIFYGSWFFVARLRKSELQRKLGKKLFMCMNVIPITIDVLCNFFRDTFVEISALQKGGTIVAYMASFSASGTKIKHCSSRFWLQFLESVGSNQTFFVAHSTQWPKRSIIFKINRNFVIIANKSKHFQRRRRKRSLSLSKIFNIFVDVRFDVRILIISVTAAGLCRGRLWRGYNDCVCAMFRRGLKHSSLSLWFAYRVSRVVGSFFTLLLLFLCHDFIIVHGRWFPKVEFTARRWQCLILLGHCWGTHNVSQ